MGSDDRQNEKKVNFVLGHKILPRLAYIKFVFLLKSFSNKRFKGDFVSFRCMILYVHY